MNYNPNLESCPRKSSFQLSAVVVIGLIFALAVVFLRGNPFQDPGVGWHLKAGELISSDFFIKKDFFLSNSYNNEINKESKVAKDWINNQWLADFIFYKIYKYKGTEGLILLLALIIFLTYGLVSSLIVSRESSISAALISISFAASLGSIQWFLRPVVFSFFFFALTLFLSFEVNKSNYKKRAFITFLAFVLWSNLHPAFILGFFIFALRLLDTYLNERKTFGSSSITSYKLGLILLITAITGSLFNPFGLYLHNAILMLGSDSYFMNLNQEWLSVKTWDPVFRPAILISILFILLTLLKAHEKEKKEIHYSSYIISIIFIALAFHTRRYLPFLGLTLIYPLSSLLTEFKALRVLDKKLTSSNFNFSNLLKIFFIGIFISLFLIPLHSNNKIALIPIPKYKLVDQETKRLLNAAKKDCNHIFHSPNIGGKITWHSWPKLKAWIDDRNELNGASKYKTYFKIINANINWKKALEKENFDCLLIEDSNLKSILEKSSGKRIAQCLWEKTTETREHLDTLETSSKKYKKAQYSLSLWKCRK